MEVRDKPPGPGGNELSHIETEPLHDGVDVWGVEGQKGPLTILDPLYDEPTPVRRDIKGLSAHGARRIWTRATRLPTAETTGVKLVPTPNRPGLSLTSHGGQTHGTLGTPVLPTPLLTFGQNLFAISTGQGLGSAPPAHTSYLGNFHRLLARATSTSSDLMASRYFSLIFSSMCFRKTTRGSSSCSMRHVGHSIEVSNQVVMHLLWKTCLHLSRLSLRFVPSRQTAHVWERCARHLPSSTAFCLHFVPLRVTESQFILY